MIDKNNLTQILLRIGLAFSLLYAALSSYFEPDAWIGWFPTFLKQLIPNPPLLLLFSTYEIVLALWLISGKKVFIPAILDAATMAGIVIFNFNQMLVVFRDVTIFFTALALALMSLA